MSFILLYFVAFVVAMSGSVYLNKLTQSGAVRILGGGVGGTVTAEILGRGAGYSFIAAAWSGGMGYMGYFFIAGLSLMLIVWLLNLGFSEGGTLIR